ncbi:MAG: adenine phosphoribosyltransferase [Candidatus Latescibacteria bacterium]|nr:adenine phosphoribosyltransferase [Candidatus Latescibacterota bacterium]
MSRFREVFCNRHVVLPVIHVVNTEQAIENTRLAKRSQADGVFLINHDLTWQTLLAVHANCVEAIPEFWIGVNCLDLEPNRVFGEVDSKVGGVWVDNALIEESCVEQPGAEKVLRAIQDSGWRGLYFGGVAFKYQRVVEDVETAARVALPFVDVVTTSGPGTGLSANPVKIRSMRSGVGREPLAVASGITPENVIEYLPFTDCFLVATGICRTIDALDEDLTTGLVSRIRNYH